MTLDRSDVVRMEIPPKLNYRFYAISIRILADFFVDINQLIQKFIWNYQALKVAPQKNLDEGEQSGALTLQNLLKSNSNGDFLVSIRIYGRQIELRVQ